MIKKLRIENLRCFREFETDLFPITLISGENNSGKSTILESLFLLYRYNIADLFLKIASFRGTDLSYFNPQSLWEPLFFEMDMTHPLAVSVADESRNTSISLVKDAGELVSIASWLMRKPDWRFDGRFATSPNLTISLVQSAERYPLRYTFNDVAQGIAPQQHTESGFYVPEPGRLYPVLEKPSGSNELPVVQYVGPNVSVDFTQSVERFGKMELAGKKAEVIRVLQMLDDQLVNLSTILEGGVGNLYATSTGGLRYPLKAMGDGINKLLAVVLMILANPGGIFLIDEVENGFHYSFYSKFWNLICRMAVESGSQIIATTHSYECIEGALKGVKDAGHEKKLGYIRLARSGETILPKIFNDEILDFALQSEMEVR